MAIRTVWTADASQADRAVAQMERSTERLERQIRQTVTASKDSGRAAAEYGSTASKSYGDVNKRLDELHQRQNVLLKEKESLKNAAREQAARERELARAAKQVYDDTRTPAERYGAQMEKLNRLVREGRISHETFGRAAKRAHQEMVGGAQQSATALGGISGRLSGIVSGLVGAAGVSSAIGTIITSHNAWLDALDEIADRIKSVQADYVSFAALQQPGQKAERVEAVAKLAATYGITDTQKAADTVQALQSVYGDYKTGLDASIEAFEASRVGIPLDLAKELEVMGKAQGAEPGEFARMAYVAGQRSGRDPETLAKAAPAMKQFADPAFGFAFSAAIAENIPVEQLATYARRGGMALGDVSSGMPWFKERGLEQATQFERLQALHKEGVTTPALVAEKIGIKEIREAEAIADAARNFDRIAQMAKQIREEAQPGLFQQERAAIEFELPQMRFARQSARLEAEAALSQIYSPAAEEAQQRRIEHQIRGLALRRMGKETSWAKPIAAAIALPARLFGVDTPSFDADLIDPEGKATRGHQVGLSLEHTLRQMFTGYDPTEFQDRLAQHELQVRKDLLGSSPIYEMQAERIKRERATMTPPPVVRESPFPGDDGAALQVTPMMEHVDRLRAAEGAGDQASERRHRELVDTLQGVKQASEQNAAETRRVAAAVANAGDRTATATQAIGRQTSDAAVQNALRPKGGSGEW
jgi:hypothetical protein